MSGRLGCRLTSIGPKSSRRSGTLTLTPYTQRGVAQMRAGRLHVAKHHHLFTSHAFEDLKKELWVFLIDSDLTMASFSTISGSLLRNSGVKFAVWLMYRMYRWAWTRAAHGSSYLPPCTGAFIVNRRLGLRPTPKSVSRPGSRCPCLFCLSANISVQDILFLLCTCNA